MRNSNQHNAQQDIYVYIKFIDDMRTEKERKRERGREKRKESFMSFIYYDRKIMFKIYCVLPLNTETDAYQEKRRFHGSVTFNYRLTFFWQCTRMLAVSGLQPASTYTCTYCRDEMG